MDYLPHVDSLNLFETTAHSKWRSGALCTLYNTPFSAELTASRPMNISANILPSTVCDHHFAFKLRGTPSRVSHAICAVFDDKIFGSVG